MKHRFLALTLTVTCTIVGLVAPRPALAIEYANGAIFFENRTDRYVDATIYYPSTIGRDVLLQVATVPPHGEHVFDRCCYAAGTRYELYVRPIAGNGLPLVGGYGLDFTPILCAGHGALHGYARLYAVSTGPNHYAVNEEMKDCP